MAVSDPGIAPARSEAEVLDRADPLASFRERFAIADPRRIYLDGNSLGRPSEAVMGAMQDLALRWRRDLVEGWADWIGMPTRVGDRLAAACLGARDGEVLVCDSVTVNLFKLAHAVLDARHGDVVVPVDEFPTDRYVLDRVARERGRRLVLAETAEAALAAKGAALVCLSLVDYRSGERRSLRRASPGGAALLWDLSHATGAVDVDLSAADLAVGCTYKYLGAGPGAPGFLYVRRELLPTLRSPIQGWFSQREQFSMGPLYEPAEGIERFLAGTPPIIGLTAVEASVALVEEAGIARIAAKGRALTDLAVRLHDAWLAPLGFRLASPRDPARRGGHVALTHADAWRIARGLIERCAVIPDFRQPDILRLGFTALDTRFVDVWDGLDRLRGLVTHRGHLEVDDAPRRVT
jgi:kynureninase